MKKLSFLLAFVSIFTACKNKQIAAEPQDSIQFKIFYTAEYCGGAAPTEEIMEQLNQPKPYSDSIYIHSMKDADRTEVAVKLLLKKGEGSVMSLPPGDYNAFITPVHQIDSASEDMGMEQCYYMQSRMPFFSFKIESTSVIISDTLLKTCDPCVPPRP